MKWYKLLIFIIMTLCIAFMILASVSILSGCKTQATMIVEKGYNEELYPECYYARYFAREGQKETAIMLADKCFKLLRESGCIKVIKDNPDIYRDFNDCWKTRE